MILKFKIAKLIKVKAFLMKKDMKIIKKNMKNLVMKFQSI